MEKFTNHPKSLAATFSSGKTMEIEAQSRFVGHGEGSRKRRKANASNASHGAQPSSASIFCDLTGLCVDLASTSSQSAFHGEILGSKSSKSLPDSNIGFKLLKKSGWKEGSGLGVSEQGRLDPLEAQFKSDRRGIGAEKNTKEKSSGAALVDLPAEASNEEHKQENQKTAKREKNLAKKARKMKAEADRIQEQAFKQDFYREFWPENV